MTSTTTKIEIKSRFGGAVIITIEDAADLRDAVVKAAARVAHLRGAYLGGAYLRGAYLRGADLRGADLRDADLRGADLRGADLRVADLGGAYLRGAYLGGADLRGAYLRGADLRGADLRDADLAEAKINWQSHALIGEILRRAAGDDIEKLKIAGLVAIQTDWCWDKWTTLGDPLTGWALDTLAAWVVEGDNAPNVLTARLPKAEAAQ